MSYMNKEDNFEDELDTEELKVLRAVDTPSSLSSSTLSRLSSPSVRITDFTESPVNPRPLHLDINAGQGHQRDVVSPQKLRMASGLDNLSDVSYLELCINSEEQMLGNFGMLLPNLTQLKLSNSCILSIRDLGTCLQNLRVLWMSRCGLEDVDGIGSLDSLEELYLSFNEISDVSPLSMLEKLEILDLESNNIREVEQLSYLTLCSSLRSLTLDGNPVCLQLPKENENGSYRDAVKGVIPHLLQLDDEVFDGGNEPSTSDLHSQSKSMFLESSEVGLETDWNIVKAGIKKQLTSELSEDQPGSDSPHSRPASSHQYGRRAPLRERPATSMGYHHSSRREDQSSNLFENDSSYLTHGMGSVMCGNPVKALKARKKQGLLAESSIWSTSQKEDHPEVEHVALDELREWRRQFGSLTSSGNVTENDRSHTSGGRQEEEEEEEGDGLVITKASSVTSLEEGSLVSSELTVQPSNLRHKETLKGGDDLSCDGLSHVKVPKRRVLPAPPTNKSDIPLRPHSVADFRRRRYRRVSNELQTHPENVVVPVVKTTAPITTRSPKKINSQKLQHD